MHNVFTLSPNFGIHPFFGGKELVIILDQQVSELFWRGCHVAQVDPELTATEGDLELFILPLPRAGMRGMYFCHAWFSAVLGLYRLDKHYASRATSQPTTSELVRFYLRELRANHYKRTLLSVS